MNEYIDHSIKGVGASVIGKIDGKVLAVVLGIELCILMMAVSKGLGESFLPVTLVLMAFSIIACTITFYMKADIRLTIIVLLLLNIGLVVQQIQSGESDGANLMFKKLLISFVAAMIAVFIYSKIKTILQTKVVIAGMILAQYIICAAMIIFGHATGDIDHQGAIIELAGITPFEIVKVLYIFTVVGLVTDDSVDDPGDITFDGRYQSRTETILLLHTLILAILFVICSELGTLLIIYSVGLITLWVFGKQRKTIKRFTIFSGISVSLLWFLSDKYLLPMVNKNVLILPGAAAKIISRFGSALHPELYINGCGYQSVRGLEALTVGGWFGIETERYRMPLPEASNDFIFDNVVQTCGLLMGFIVIILFLVLLKRGILIFKKTESGYDRKAAFVITIEVTIQAIVHIGYNISLLPVSGIPLYFVSQGFTALTTGMILIGVLLVTSADGYARGGHIE